MNIITFLSLCGYVRLSGCSNTFVKSGIVVHLVDRTIGDNESSVLHINSTTLEDLCANHNPVLILCSYRYGKNGRNNYRVFPLDKSIVHNRKYGRDTADKVFCSDSTGNLIIRV